MQEVDFLNALLRDRSAAWSVDAISTVSGLSVPDRILGRRRSDLLKSDIRFQWADWFVEGLSDSFRYLDPTITYPHIFSDVHVAVEKAFPDATKPERADLARLAANIIERNANSIRRKKERVRTGREQRIVLLELSGSPPRCWICGLKFSDVAIDNFMDGSSHMHPPSPFIDILKPIGLKQQDLRIEIDHVHPFSHGGEEDDNLRLSCGWCNRQKSAMQSLYDVEGKPLRAGNNTFGINTLPQKFWVVRILALQRSCEHPDGCAASCDTHEMRIAPINENGAMNPANLQVTCPEHDPLKDIRLQRPDTVTALWTSKS